MKYGVQALSYGASWADALDVAKRIDGLGYDYLFSADHLYSTGGDPQQQFFEGWLTVAAWAQATERVRVGLTVGNNTFRNPGVVAKMAATIDHIADGRSILGMGAGNVEAEVAAHGLQWAPAGTRLDWLDESLTLIRRVLAGETVTHDGPTYHFDGVRQNPVPVQQPLPIIIGAEGEKKGLRLAAKHADIWQMFVGIDDVAGWRRKDAIFREHAATLGRDASAVERMIGCKLMIRSTEAAARRAAEEFIAIHRWGAVIWDVFWATTPDRVADALLAFADAGVDSFTPQVGWPYDQETLEAVIGPVAEQVNR